MNDTFSRKKFVKLKPELRLNYIKKKKLNRNDFGFISRHKCLTYDIVKEFFIELDYDNLVTYQKINKKTIKEIFIPEIKKLMEAYEKKNTDLDDEVFLYGYFNNFHYIYISFNHLELDCELLLDFFNLLPIRLKEELYKPVLIEELDDTRWSITSYSQYDSLRQCISNNKKIREEEKNKFFNYLELIG